MQVKPFAIVWTQEHIELLTTRVVSGDSASMISRRLFEMFGVHYSRNAVIGKTIRLGLSLHGKPGTNIHRMMSANTNTPFNGNRAIKRQMKLIVAVVDTIDFIGPIGEIPDHDSGQCCYVVGELIKDFVTCGKTASRNKRGRMTSYCDYHRTIVYEKPRVRTREDQSSRSL